MNYENLSEIEKSIGAKIKVVRGIKGYSQMAIADELGVTFQQVQKYENGSNRISPGKLFLLAMLFNIPISDFFEDIDNQKLNSSAEPLIGNEEIEVLHLFKSIKEPRLRKKIIELCRIMDDLDKTPLKQK